MKSFETSFARTIRDSLGRFLAIAVIVALGCGFYGGLRMSGPVMRSAADRFYDGTQLYDIRVLSSLGFSDVQADLVSELDGVRAVMPAKSTDAMGDINGEQYAVRVSSVPLEYLASSTCEDGCLVASPHERYLNRLVLEQGRWPKAKGECVISADRVAGVPFEMGDKLEVLYGSQDLDGVLAVRSLTIVGTAHSSSFVSAVTMGSTSLGNGSIQQFAYVSPDTFEEDCPYTELFVSVDGSDALFSGSSEYDERVGDVVDKLEDLSSDIAASRLAEIKEEAQSELDEKSDEYEREKSDAIAKLDDAERELERAESELASGRDELSSGYESYETGSQEYDERAESAQSALDSTYDMLVATQSKLDAAQEELDRNRDAVSAWPQQRSELQSQLEQARSGLATAQEALRSFEDMESQIEALPADNPMRLQVEGQIASRQAERDQAEEAVHALPVTISQIESAIAQGDEQVAQFEQREQEVQLGYEELSLGWTEYYRASEEARSQLEEAQASLDQARDRLEKSQKEVETGSAELESGRKDYEEERSRALDELADAARVIADAQADIDSLEAPEIYVLDRTKNYGVSSQVADSERIDNIAAVFPFIFFLVAALVSLTTMTRMVDEERTLIGTFKALGYGRAKITGRYLGYAFIASATGAVLGLAVLSQLLPHVIEIAYRIIYNIPTYPFPLPFDWKVGLAAGGLGVGVTLIATLAAAMATLREQPARLMLPRAPKAGKRILLERLPGMWRRFSFSWKVTLRNLFRYKKRFFMTVVGIAGCTALLLTGLGLHDAIWDIIDRQYGPVLNYNVIVKMESESSDARVRAVERQMEGLGEAEDIARVMSINMQVASDGSDAMGVEVVVVSSPQRFARLLTMKERASQLPLAFDDSSVVLTEKIASKLGLSVGDEFVLYDQDEIGNPLGEGYRFVLSGIMENYIGNWAYLGRSAFEEATEKRCRFTALYGRCTEDESKRAAFTDKLHGMDGVQTVTYNDETIDSYRKMLSSVDLIVVVLVVAAAALAFIVLFNLTNINITERRREIASLKVLGFSKREVYSYIFREIILISIIGALAGLVFGTYLESFVAVTAEVDYVMFGRNIHLASYVISFIVTLLFTAFVMLFMRGKLSDIDMVESLKSVE